MNNVGDTAVYDIPCRDQDNKLFDPDVVEVSIVHGDEREELVTYGGTEPHDNWLSKVSTGNYRLIVTIQAPGALSILPRWKHHTALGDGLLVITPQRPTSEFVPNQGQHQFKDRTL